MTSELPLCSRGIDLASEVLWLQNALKTIIMLIAVRRAGGHSGMDHSRLVELVAT